MLIAGPTAIVQFSVWERGEVMAADTLTQRLLQAVRFAVCDIVMEYRLLTAPLCEAPPHYTRGQESPRHSAPPSPVAGAGEKTCARSAGTHTHTYTHTHGS